MTDDKVWVSLTNEPINSKELMDLVRSPEAGAIVLFAGTTRNNFQGSLTGHSALIRRAEGRSFGL